MATFQDPSNVSYITSYTFYNNRKPVVFFVWFWFRKYKCHRAIGPVGELKALGFMFMT